MAIKIRPKALVKLKILTQMFQGGWWGELSLGLLNYANVFVYNNCLIYNVAFISAPVSDQAITLLTVPINLRLMYWILFVWCRFKNTKFHKECMLMGSLALFPQPCQQFCSLRKVISLSINTQRAKILLITKFNKPFRLSGVDAF